MRTFRTGDMAGLVLLMILGILPFLCGSKISSFGYHVLIQVFLFASMAQAWNIIGGYGGQISFGHSVFFGIGAYGAALAVVKHGLTPWPGIITGAAVASIVAIIISYPCFKLKGHYFAIATFAIVEITNRLFMVWDYVNGALGLDYMVAEEGFLNFMWYDSKLGYYYGALILAITIFGFARWLEAHRFGAYLRAVREGQEVAESLGVNSTSVKLSAMAFSAFLTALCGSFYAQYNLRVDPSMVISLDMSMKFVLIAILGGTGTLYGPLLGASLLLPLQEFTRARLSVLGPGIDLIIFGILIVFFVVWQPGGLIGLLGRSGKRTGSMRMVADEYSGS